MTDSLMTHQNGFFASASVSDSLMILTFPVKGRGYPEKNARIFGVRQRGYEFSYINVCLCYVCLWMFFVMILIFTLKLTT